MKRLSCRELLEGGPPEEDALIDGPELTKLYWAMKQRENDLARRERYWGSLSDGLKDAYGELEAKTAELRALREELERANRALAERVAEQGTQIVRQSSEVDALQVQLKERVRDRSRELRAALERAGTDVTSLAPGTVVGGRARVVRKLGDGGMGSVYEAEDLLTKRLVALKLLRGADRTALGLFVAEAESASAVSHPAIVRTLHIDVADDGVPYQLMDLVRGVTLRRRIDRSSLRFGEAARILAALAFALAAAHAQGVVHRDVKPDNVLLSSEPPGLRVLDFGVAKLLRDEETRVDRLVVGTPGYMAPEQILPDTATTPAADVYSLGVMLFELVAGQKPFKRASVEDVLVAHLYAPPPALGGPPELSAIASACLEKQPTARPTAATLADRLEKFADEAKAPSIDVLGRDALMHDETTLV